MNDKSLERLEKEFRIEFNHKTKTCRNYIQSKVEKFGSIGNIFSLLMPIVILKENAATVHDADAIDTTHLS